MSIYLLNPKHFNSIEINLQRFLNSGVLGSEAHDTLKKAAPQLFGAGGTPREQGARALVNHLRLINVVVYHLATERRDIFDIDSSGEFSDSLKEKINEDWNNLVNNTDHYEVIDSLPVFYKALQTLWAQINAGTPAFQEVFTYRPPSAEETQALIFLSELMRVVANELVCALPQYINAPWEIE